MIARIWTAEASPTNGQAYAAHFASHVVPAVQSVPGYAGSLLLTQRAGGAVRIQVITFWESLDAVRGFAGPDVTAAVVADDARRLLTSFETSVRHFDVVSAQFSKGEPWWPT
jgi:heme-degrading monooxygenase HmoA